MSSHENSAVCHYVAPDQPTKAAEAASYDVEPSSETLSPQSTDTRWVLLSSASEAGGAAGAQSAQ